MNDEVGRELLWCMNRLDVRLWGGRKGNGDQTGIYVKGLGAG